jgi:uncharacterized membrane protein (DUF485 family)
MGVRRSSRQLRSDASHGADAAAGREAPPRLDPADLEGVAQSGPYGRLTARRRRFVLVAGGLFYGLFAVFVALAAWAHDLMATRIAGGLTVGYAAAVVVVLGVWATVFAYSRASRRVFDQLAADAQATRRP